jgi:hypothetical protein
VGLLITVIVVYVFWGDVPLLLDLIAVQCRCRLFRGDLDQPDSACFVLSSHLPEKAGCFESRGFPGKVESRHCSAEVVGTVRLGVADCGRSRYEELDVIGSQIVTLGDGCVERVRAQSRFC